MSDETLKEMKATGEDSANMEPVAPAGGSPKGENRKADVNKSVDPKVDEIEDTVKTPQGSNNTGLKEAFDGLFEGADLSEDFKNKTFAVFEAAVHERVLEEQAALEEQFENDLAEQVEAIAEDMETKLNSYLDYVVEQWLEENEVAIESAFKVEVAESFMEGVAALMSEHRLDIDEGELDAIAEMEDRVSAIEEKYNSTVEKLMTVKEEKETLEREIAFAEVSEGLTDTQAYKLSVLAEGVSFDSLDEYREKISAIKESYFKESVTASNDETEYLEESVEEDNAPSIDPTVARYAETLGRLAK
jgi:CRISPR/Cas system CMR-associated protein Cmr5 small subunit